MKVKINFKMATTIITYVEDKLKELTIEELMIVSEGMEISDHEKWNAITDQKKKKRQIQRAIEDSMDEIDDVNEKLETIKQGILPYFPLRMKEDIIAYLEGKNTDVKKKDENDDSTSGEYSAKVTSADESHRTTSNLKGASREDTDDLNKFEGRSERNKMERLEETVTLLKCLGLDSVTSSLRREFKFSGSIGSGHKDSLNYISICGQVHDAKKKNYTDDEILAAIKKATVPGTSLRTYLDAKKDRSLESVLTLIRYYLKEKGSTELLNDLRGLCQMEGEDSQLFILRAMELREKILIASEGDSETVVDKSLVQSMFVRTLTTGLTDDYVKIRISPLLRAGVSDDVIIREVNQAMSEDLERKQKMGQDEPHRRVKVNQVSLPPKDSTTENAISVAVAPLLEQVKEMAAAIQGLQKEVTQLQAKKTGYQGGCKDCRTKGIGNTCRHCWKCGAGDHISLNCPLRNANNPPSNS